MDDRRPLYLIRHGQTAWNLEGRLQGGRDSPLTDLGKRQAQALAIGLRPVPPASILASPLGRARKTAAIIAQSLKIPVEEDARLGELRFGAAEGLTTQEINKRWPNFLSERERDKWQARWPDGESYADGEMRITTFVEDGLKPHWESPSTRPLAIVAHETINMILIGKLLTLDPPLVTRLGQPNHVIYRLRGGVIDHAHLGDDDLEWIPGILQKRSDDILHVAA